MRFFSSLEAYDLCGRSCFVSRLSYLCTASFNKGQTVRISMKKLKITEMKRLDADAFRKSEKLPLAVVLDDVRSMNNIGSVLRTADAFRLSEVCLCGITATPPHPDIHKTALGAEDSVAWHYFETAMEAVHYLQNKGFRLFALEQAHGSIPLNRFEPEHGEAYALVLGNEVKGVGQTVVDACAGCLEIPQYGTKHSLNVSVAAGIAIWQVAAPLLERLVKLEEER